jgi:hypothetical protein
MTLTGRGLVSLGVCAVALLAVVLSLEFNEKARVFPLTTGLLTFVLAGLLFLEATYPNDRRLSFLRQKGVLNEGVEAGKVQLEETPDDDPAPWRVVFLGFASICGFVLLMYFVSYLVAIPVFLVASIVLISKGKLVPAILVALSTEVLVYLIFELLL